MFPNPSSSLRKIDEAHGDDEEEATTARTTGRLVGRRAPPSSSTSTPRESADRKSNLFACLPARERLGPVCPVQAGSRKTTFRRCLRAPVYPALFPLPTFLPSKLLGEELRDNELIKLFAPAESYILFGLRVFVAEYSTEEDLYKPVANGGIKYQRGRFDYT